MCILKIAVTVVKDSEGYVKDVLSGDVTVGVGLKSVGEWES